MFSFIFLFIFAIFVICFFLLSLVFFAVHSSHGKKQPFKKAAEDVVDTLIIMPLSWIVSALYVGGLLVLFVLRFILKIFNIRL
ncbi:hypothetical protein AM592_15345 [Bacillus gobiensis]|uniref:Uncharacterized protein n=1 Tax=Bacillus gobiensis TaxID=1441095 RepID=A0A0M3RA99_9BACI|nr:hypothetical protein AM592_15345 [Bacillus gobiensis]